MGWICVQFENLCNDFIGIFADADSSIDDLEIVALINNHDPSGTSVQNMMHW